MQRQEVAELLKKYLAGNCTEQEQGILETWYLKYEEKGLPELSQEAKDGQLEEVWTFLSDNMDASSAPARFLWVKIAVAATMLITLSIGFYFYKSSDKIESGLTREISHSVKLPNN